MLLCIKLDGTIVLEHLAASLKMEAPGSSVTLVSVQHITENHDLYGDHSEVLKCDTLFNCLGVN